MSTDKVQRLASEVRAYCKANANPALVSKYARYFREGYDAWGLLDAKHALWTEQVPRWIERYGELGLDGFLRAGVPLFASGKYEEGGVAIRMVKSRADELSGESVAGLAKWFEAGIGNWAHVDVLCGEVLGPALERGRIKLTALGGWRKSKLKYQRRAVPVAMLNLVKSGAEIPPLLEFVRPLMLDPERVVHQGVGWFLRECWKKQPAPVESFLLEWKDTAPRLIYQYATEKMTAAGKNRFRKGA